MTDSRKPHSREYDPDEPIFSSGDIASICDVTRKDIENWTARGIIDFGRMTRAGRRLYSFKDLAQLAIIVTLDRKTPADLTLARKIASEGLFRAEQMISAGQDTAKLDWLFRGGVAYLRVSMSGDEPRIMRVVGYDWLKKDPPTSPEMLIPVDAILVEAFARAWKLLQEGN